MNPLTIHTGDCRDVLKTLESESVHCIVSSPPYWGLRSYLPNGHADKAREIGAEKTPEEFVATMVGIFREARRALRDDGTLWLNLGDSYAGGGGFCPTAPSTLESKSGKYGIAGAAMKSAGKVAGFKPKDLIGIPWRVAMALQADGWYLRQWMPWVKKNAMPESVTDRPASACEIIFLLSKSADYYYDNEAVKLPASMALMSDPRWRTGSNANNDKDGYADAKAQNPKGPHRMFDKQRGHSRRHDGFNDRWDKMEKEEQCSGWRTTRNTDWFFEGMLTDQEGWPVAMMVNPAPFKEAHFATFPPALVRPCVLAGCPTGGTVLDPFGGSGTTGQVAIELGRKAILIELNKDYAAMAERRCNVTPGLPL